jgi:CelD/BcsL family acetyltransferase involved in cellulose biosynthesis
MTSLRIECVCDAVKLESLKGDFDRLSNGAVVQRLCWLLPWWEAYQASHTLHVLVAYRGEEVCGILPLAETSLVVTGRTLVFMGSGKVCSDDLGILVKDSDSQEIAEAFATWLVESPDCCRWDHLDLDGVRENNRTMELFGQHLAKLTGSPIERKSSPNCWSASLVGGIDVYGSRLTKRARKIVREAESAISSGEGVFEIAQTLEQALDYVDEIEQMHQARWREQGIEGCFASSAFRTFLKEAVRSMWNEPWFPLQDMPEVYETPGQQRVQVSLLRIHGVPAAGCICYLDRDSLAMYLTGMNPKLAENRPGWMLNTCFIKRAIALGCTRFDFLRGDEEYKERLGGEPTVQHRWVVPANRLSSQVRNVAYRAAVSVKRWWTSSENVSSN